jgi:large subunit ribosomal protein L32
MAEPKKRLTSTRSGNRRSHLGPETKSQAICSHCKSPVTPHQVCKVCGFYKGQDVLKLEEKAKAKEDRRKAREKEEEAESTNSEAK